MHFVRVAQIGRRHVQVIVCDLLNAPVSHPGALLQAQLTPFGVQLIALFLQALQLHGEVSYLQGEDLTVTASVNINQFKDLHSQVKPWGLLPVEFNTHFKWQAFKDFWAKLDLFAFSGAQYRSPTDGVAFKGDNGADMNAGVEFRITRQLNLWFQMNNLFNNKYERWHQYQVYGFNVLGGIIFSFGDKK